MIIFHIDIPLSYGLHERHIMFPACKLSGTHEPLYNTVHYNMVLNTSWFKDGSQKYIDYIEK